MSYPVTQISSELKDLPDDIRARLTELDEARKALLSQLPISPNANRYSLDRVSYDSYNGYNEHLGDVLPGNSNLDNSSQGSNKDRLRELSALHLGDHLDYSHDLRPITPMSADGSLGRGEYAFNPAQTEQSNEFILIFFFVLIRLG